MMYGLKYESQIGTEALRHESGCDAAIPVNLPDRRRDLCPGCGNHGMARAGKSEDFQVRSSATLGRDDASFMRDLDVTNDVILGDNNGLRVDWRSVNQALRHLG